MMEDKLPKKVQELKEFLNKIGYEIRGRYPNRRIYTPNGQYTGYRVMDDHIEIERKSLGNMYACITYFHFAGAKIEMVENDCVSVGTDKCFVLFMNHNIE